jgi:hypothetical protein
LSSEHGQRSNERFAAGVEIKEHEPMEKNKYKFIDHEVNQLNNKSQYGIKNLKLETSLSH